MAKKIVIVDDDHSIKSIFEFILMQAGYEVIAKETGKEALKTLQNETDIALCFLDTSLPDMSTESLCDKIIKSTPTLPVILMANTQQADILNEAFKLGAYGIIYKPFDVEEVLTLISTILGD